MKSWHPLAIVALVATFLVLLFFNIADRAVAQPSPDLRGAPGRFQMAPTRDGTIIYLLDSQTGGMAMCFLRGRKLLCEPMPTTTIASYKDLKP